MKDWNRAKPGPREVEKALSTLNVEEVIVDDPAVLEYAGLLKKMHGNGDFIIRCFTVKGNRVIDWYARRGLFNEINFFKHFINHPNVLGSLPAQLSQNSIDDGTFQFNYEYCVHIDRVLYKRALLGGANFGYEGGRWNLMELVYNVCNAVFEFRYNDVRLYQGHSHWSPWFHGFIDGTLIIIDVRTAKIWLILYTDVD